MRLFCWTTMALFRGEFRSFEFMDKRMKSVFRRHLIRKYAAECSIQVEMGVYQLWQMHLDQKLWIGTYSTRSEAVSTKMANARHTAGVMLARMAHIEEMGFTISLSEFRMHGTPSMRDFEPEARYHDGLPPE